MKANGGTFLLRIELERERGLTDAEWRLWLVYRSLCGWDRNKSDFGVADITIVGLQKYLDWSAGSICTTRQSLVVKNKLKKIKGSRYKVVDAEKLFKPNFRQAEIGIQGIENAVQWAEEKQHMAEFSRGQKSVKKPSFLRHEFQPVEFRNTPKETIKKDKEIREEKIPLKEEEDKIPYWHRPEVNQRIKEQTENNKKAELSRKASFML